MPVAAQTPPPDGCKPGAKKRPRGKPFTGRDDPRNGRPSPGPPGDRIAAVADPAAEATLYEDMLHVRRKPRSEDRTEGQRDCRRWKKADLKGFLTKFADLEKAALGGKLPGQAKPGAEPYLEDAGSDRVEALIDELLRKANDATTAGRIAKLVAACQLALPQLSGEAVEAVQAAVANAERD
jgi:hypothetical protein